MYATGRKPNTVSVGADAAGIALDADGAIIVDEQYTTNIPNIYALGDVTDRINLTPGRYSRRPCSRRSHCSAMRDIQHLYENVPTAVFSNPPIGTVGLTEAEARIGNRRGRCISVELSAAASCAFGQSFAYVGQARRRPKHGSCAWMPYGRLWTLPRSSRASPWHLIAARLKSQFDATIGLHPTAAEEFVTMSSKAR